MGLLSDWIGGALGLSQDTQDKIGDALAMASAANTPGGNPWAVGQQRQQMRMAQTEARQNMQYKDLQMQQLKFQLDKLKGLYGMLDDNGPSQAPQMPPGQTNGPQFANAVTSQANQALSGLPVDYGASVAAQTPAQPMLQQQTQQGGAPNSTLGMSNGLKALLQSNPSARDAFRADPVGFMSEFSKSVLKNQELPDSVRADQWAGISPQQRAAIAAGIDMRPGQVRAQIGPDGQTRTAYIAPNIGENTMPVQLADGSWGVQSIPGNAAAQAQLSGAKTRAQQANTIFTGVQGPEGAPQAGFGGQLFGGGGQAAQAAPAGAAQGAFSGDPAAIKAQIMQIRDPADRAAALGAFNRQMFNGQAPQQPGIVTGQNPLAAKNAAGASDRVGQIVNDAAAAPTVISQLQNIKGLASKAITGQDADKREYINGLLSLVGFQGATDTKTATDLLNKNANQIVATLGQNGLGTDAARSIVAAGNPNNHMTPEAINEAVGQLVGVQAMKMAKAKILAPVQNNQQAFTAAEQRFNQVADPRVFQFMAMSPPEQATFKRNLATNPQDFSRFRQSLGALEQMGALQ